MQMLWWSEPKEATIQDIEQAAERPRIGVHAGVRVVIWNGEEPPRERPSSNQEPIKSLLGELHAQLVFFL